MSTKHNSVSLSKSNISIRKQGISKSKITQSKISSSSRRVKKEKENGPIYRLYDNETGADVTPKNLITRTQPKEFIFILLY